MSQAPFYWCLNFMNLHVSIALERSNLWVRPITPDGAVVNLALWISWALCSVGLIWRT